MSDLPDYPPRKLDRFRQISIKTFMLCLLLPIFLLISVMYAHIVWNLDIIEERAQQISNLHLPNILEEQRNAINLAHFRRFAELSYFARDPQERRVAGINASALAAVDVLGGNADLQEYAPRAQLLIRQINEAKNNSAEAWAQLQAAELALTGNLSALAALSGPQGSSLSIPTELIDQVNDLGLRTEDMVLRRISEIQVALQPALALCTAADTSNQAASAALCVSIGADFAQLQEQLLAYAGYEQQAHAAWGELDDILRLLSDAVSMVEAESSYTSLHTIGGEVDRLRTATMLSVFFLISIALLLAVLMHRYLLRPISTAAEIIRQMRFGKAPEAMQPVRIKELQELLELLPDLSNHMSELNALSSKLEEEKDKYVSMSYVDGLTGVNNRRSFDNHIKHENRMSAVSVLMLDVDMFKLYNDTLGHQAGDQALASVAKAIEETLLRSTDRVFRYGGEEFAVILPDASEHAAISVAQRIIIGVQDLNIPHPASSVAPYLTVSIGAATRNTGESISYTELVERADKALYKAKKTGRNQVCVYRPGDSAPPEKPAE